MNYVKPYVEDPELEEAARKATAAANFLALCSIVEDIQIKPGPNYKTPVDYEELAGKLECKVCLRPIREHGVAEWHTR